MIELRLEQTKQHWEFTATRGNEVLASGEMIPYEDKVLIHNTVNAWNRNLLSVYREIFWDLRGMLKTLGYHLLIASSDKYDDKMGKFWRIMGIEIIADAKINGTDFKLGVMEI